MIMKGRLLIIDYFFPVKDVYENEKLCTSSDINLPYRTVLLNIRLIGHYTKKEVCSLWDLNPGFDLEKVTS
jgi:hypothetical protein